jgi:L-fuculose-phosphate aldolase
MDYRNMTDETVLIDLMLDVGHRLWARGYVAANDGNMSVRIGKDELLITPTGVSKGFMTRDMIIRMTMDGKVVSPEGKYRPSSEYRMHVQVYRERDDIASVVHAHPPYCTAFAVAGIPLDKCALPEAVLMLGAVPVVPYGTPSTEELPDSIKEYIKKGDAILLANHGALTAGADLHSAYQRMETLEHTAKIMHLAMGLGNVNILSKKQITKLLEVREKMKISGRIKLSEKK